jgi:translation initiation factor 4G
VCYAAQKAKRLGLDFTMFLGELFKRQIITEYIIHECVKKLSCNVEHPEEDELENLCQLLQMVGQMLDTRTARGQMNVYFMRMKELSKGLNVSFRMQCMLQVGGVCLSRSIKLIIVIIGRR